MFKGYINEKEYKDQGEYYRDLNEMQKSGKSFTANCSYSTQYDDFVKNKEDEKEPTCECINTLIPDLDDLYAEYLQAEDKRKWMEDFKNTRKFVLPKGISQEKLQDSIQHKLASLKHEKAFYSDQLQNTKEEYNELDYERTKTYNNLKNLNEKIESLYGIGEECQDCLDMIYWLEGNYNQALLPKEEQPCKIESKEVTEDKEYSIDDLLESFKSMYEKLLS